MKVSQLTDDEIMNLTDNQIEHIIFDNINIDDSFYDYGIVLGGKPIACGPRAEKAARLYREGKVGKLIVSGGVKWETDEGLLCESEIMRNVLLKNRVPKKDIIIDRLAESTKENMIYSSLKIIRDSDDEKEISVVIVTSFSQLKRSIALAERLLPRQFKIGGAYAENTDDFPMRWRDNESKRARVMREILIYPSAIKGGWMDDIEF